MKSEVTDVYDAANLEFAKRLVESLAPRVKNGTGTQLVLSAGEVGALHHILREFMFGIRE